MIMSIEEAAIKASYDLWFIHKLCKDGRVSHASNELSTIVEYDDILWHKRQTVLRSRSQKELDKARRIRDIEELGFDKRFSGVKPVRKVGKSVKKVNYE